MKKNPYDTGGQPHRFDRIRQYAETASSIAGAVNSLYQAGKVVAPYVAAALA